MPAPDGNFSEPLTKDQACLLVEAWPGGLLGELVAAFIRTEFPCLLVRMIAAVDAAMVRVARDGGDFRMAVFGTLPDPQTLARMASCGDQSFVTLDSSSDELRTAVHRLLEGGPAFLSSSLVRLLALSSCAAGSTTRGGLLTPRESEVVRLLAMGLSNLEMAEQLVVSTNTIRAHLQAISSKLGVTGRTRVIAQARASSLI